MSGMLFKEPMNSTNPASDWGKNMIDTFFKMKPGTKLTVENKTQRQIAQVFQGSGYNGQYWSVEQVSGKPVGQGMRGRVFEKLIVWRMK